MRRRFPNVWYATQEKMDSLTKFVVFSDRGSLKFTSGELRYRGLQVDFSIENILSVSLCRQRVPWVGYLITNIATFAVLGSVSLIVYSCMLNPKLLYILLAIIPFVALVILGNLAGILVGMSTKWIQIEFEEEPGHVERVYFADGSMFGWQGVFGGTARLFREIESTTTTS